MTAALTAAVTAAVALRAAVLRLKAAQVPDPARDARLLLAYALGVGSDRLTMHLPDLMPTDAAARFEAAVTARAARTPVSQIIGRRAFWGHEFRVTPDVLDPRPDTETLVAAALEQPFARVLDLGTGSGAIVLTLLAEHPAATAVGVDLSTAAIAVAQGNAERLGVAGRVALLRSDWFGAVTGRFDLIVSNPPYIAADEMALLSPEVRDHEPHMALTPGGDGLDAYRHIAAKAGAYLTKGGRILLEIGPTQASAVTGMLANAGFAEPVCLTDIDGRDRVIAANWPG